ncbi:hypothetical protein PM082_021876 [Marasmius tenuissimus]|nr:hypothetical protein PM082_021876 [Marasmius tenuissimus]
MFSVLRWYGILTRKGKDYPGHVHHKPKGSVVMQRLSNTPTPTIPIVASILSMSSENSASMGLPPQRPCELVVDPRPSILPQHSLSSPETTQKLAIT